MDPIQAQQVGVGASLVSLGILGHGASSVVHKVCLRILFDLTLTPVSHYGLYMCVSC
jgi:hypothetical protein